MKNKRQTITGDDAAINALIHHNDFDGTKVIVQSLHYPNQKVSVMYKKYGNSPETYEPIAMNTDDGGYGKLVLYDGLFYTSFGSFEYGYMAANKIAQRMRLGTFYDEGEIFFKGTSKGFPPLFGPRHYHFMHEEEDLAFRYTPDGLSYVRQKFEEERPKYQTRKADRISAESAVITIPVNSKLSIRYDKNTRRLYMVSHGETEEYEGFSLKRLKDMYEYPELTKDQRQAVAKELHQHLDQEVLRQAIRIYGDDATARHYNIVAERKPVMLQMDQRGLAMVSMALCLDECDSNPYEFPDTDTGAKELVDHIESYFIGKGFTHEALTLHTRMWPRSRKFYKRYAQKHYDACMNVIAGHDIAEDWSPQLCERVCVYLLRQDYNYDKKYIPDQDPYLRLGLDATHQGMDIDNTFDTIEDIIKATRRGFDQTAFMGSINELLKGYDDWLQDKAQDVGSSEPWQEKMPDIERDGYRFVHVNAMSCLEPQHMAELFECSEDDDEDECSIKEKLKSGHRYYFYVYHDDKAQFLLIMEYRKSSLRPQFNSGKYQWRFHDWWELDRKAGINKVKRAFKDSIKDLPVPGSHNKKAA